MEREVGVQARCWQLPVLSNRGIGGRYRELVLDAPELARSLRPGQFVNVLCAEGNDPFLRRPLSVARIGRERGTISFLYEVIGHGTRLMAGWAPGDFADVLGPLGNWFRIPAGEGTLVLVAGGIGVAPLVALAEETAPTGRPLHVLLGARSADGVLCEDIFRNAGAAVSVATDDGSRGHHGFVSKLLEETLRPHGGAPAERFDAVFACGPRAMMAATCAVAQNAGVPCFVSMEVGMACGFGVCMGCAWRVRPPNGAADAPAYRLVCVDGPVFNASDILWELPSRPDRTRGEPEGCGDGSPRVRGVRGADPAAEKEGRDG